MTDEIIGELWKIKDDIAEEHGYDLDALVASLRENKTAARRRLEDLGSIHTTAEKGVPADAGRPGGASR